MDLGTKIPHDRDDRSIRMVRLDGEWIVRVTCGACGNASAKKVGGAAGTAIAALAVAEQWWLAHLEAS